MDSAQTHFVIKVNYADTLRRLTIGMQPSGDCGLTFAELETKIREMFQFPTSANLKLTYLDKEKDVITMQNDEDLKDVCIYQCLNPLRLNVVLASSEAPFGGEASGTSNFNAAFQRLDEPLREVLKNLRPENLKTMFQAYEPLFKDVKNPNQIRDLVENVVKTVGSQFASLSKNARFSNADATTSAPPINREQTIPQDRAAQTHSDVFRPSVHYGVACDGCDMSPITGTRYMSTTKGNYDLCSSCYGKSGASAGEYIVVERPVSRGRHGRFHHHRGRMMCPAAGGHLGFMPRHPHCGMRAPHDTQGGRLDARFVRDISVFDGTELAPGTRFTKIWRLRNSGAVSWPADTKLVNVDGDDLGSGALIPLEIGEQGLAPEEEVEVSVDCVAPLKAGRYQSIWRLAAPWGPKFGHKIWVQIQVVPSDTLNQLTQVDTDNSSVQVDGVREISTATDSDEVQKGGETSFSVPVEEINSEYQIQPEFSTLFTRSLETTKDSVSQAMKGLEESFVKVDVSSVEDKTPVIQMSEMPSDSSENEKVESYIRNLVSHHDVITSPAEEVTTKFPAEELAESKETKAPIDIEGNDASLYNPLLAKLEAMGFSDAALNLELLIANARDMRKTVDALCEVDDWAPALADLAEMGFNNAYVNRRLMFKHGGNLKRVVKELVQQAKNSYKKEE
ncbi:hypothetical protein R1flu_011185 [Riccia fluitans]|uniref:ZZ-type domain-containing protein n=1 Tax=Riccia fluitans TaxID=41844 RepID=A0ABD1Z797_9MARC